MSDINFFFLVLETTHV